VDCVQRTFREQIPDLAVRYARRTPSLAGLIGDLAVKLAGRATSAALEKQAVMVSRTTVLRLVMALPAGGGPVPRVLSVDDFALRRGSTYATMIIDPVTHERVDVLPDRKAETLAAWLRDHPGVQVVCRDGSAAYAEGIRRANPEIVQVSDRWHVWHNLAAVVEKTVAGHSGCWNASPARPADGPVQQRAVQRWTAVHDLRNQGVGLMECSRRLGLSLNTIKKYARVPVVEQLARPRKFRETLVCPYREHLRRRLAENPNLPVTHLLAEIREIGYPGSANLLVRYLNQGRADPERTPPAPRRLASWIMTKPTNLPDHLHRHLDDLVVSCPHLTALTTRVREFAAILTQRHGDKLPAWIQRARADDLPALHSYTNGLEKDIDAVIAGLTLPYSNGPMEGVNTKTKLIKRTMYGRAGFPLLRQMILLN
jgi:hypothetical protein